MSDDSLSPVVEVHALRHAAKDWRLSRGDIGVFAVLLEHARPGGLTFPGPARISAMANLAVPNVKASIVKLAQFGYVRIERRGHGRANHYHLCRSPAIPDRPKTGNARIPSFRKRAADNQSRQHTQLTDDDDAQTGYAGMHELGMPAFTNSVCRRDTNSLFNSPKNSLSDFQSVEEQEEQEELATENPSSDVTDRRDVRGLLERLSRNMDDDFPRDREDQF